MAPKRTLIDAEFVCSQCVCVFSRRVNPAARPRLFCSPACHMAFECDRRRRFPKDVGALYAALHDMYVSKRMTTIEIGAVFGADHKSVIAAMERAGIPRRGVGSSRYETCCDGGCTLRVHKVKHKTNGSMYGKRCRLHWIVFRMQVNQRYNDARRGKDESWLRRMRQLLARVQRLNREVSQSLKQESEPETTLPAACLLS